MDIQDNNVNILTIALHKWVFYVSMDTKTDVSMRKRIVLRIHTAVLVGLRVLFGVDVLALRTGAK